jgi:hypothetical protein
LTKIQNCKTTHTYTQARKPATTDHQTERNNNVTDTNEPTHLQAVSVNSLINYLSSQKINIVPYVFTRPHKADLSGAVCYFI